MIRIAACSLSLWLVLSWPLEAAATEQPQGTVLELSGETGSLIVSRDAVIYYLEQGSDLFESDILRLNYGSETTIIYNGCVFNLPDGEDVVLDDQFCVMAKAIDENSSMAATAASGGREQALFLTGSNAPLVVGGVLLSAGGIAAATGGDGGGSGSLASAATGNPSANPGSP